MQHAWLCALCGIPVWSWILFEPSREQGMIQHCAGPFLFVKESSSSDCISFTNTPLRCFQRHKSRWFCLQVSTSSYELLDFAPVRLPCVRHSRMVLASVGAIQVRAVVWLWWTRVSRAATTQCPPHAFWGLRGLFLFIKAEQQLLAFRLTQWEPTCSLSMNERHCAWKSILPLSLAWVLEIQVWALVWEVRQWWATVWRSTAATPWRCPRNKLASSILSRQAAPKIICPCGSGNIWNPTEQKGSRFHKIYYEMDYLRQVPSIPGKDIKTN